MTKSTKEALKEYINAKADKAGVVSKIDDSAQEFIKSLMGDTPEEARSAYEIIRARVYQADRVYDQAVIANLLVGTPRENANVATEEAVKFFFGCAYEKLTIGK